MGFMVRIKFLAPLIAAAALLIVGSVFAADATAGGNGAQTFTENYHRQADIFYDVGLCGESGVSWEISEIGTGVFHATELANGTYHITGTFLGQVTIRGIDTELVEGEDGFVPANPDYGYLDSYPTYTGRYTVWFGENSNRQNAAGILAATHFYRRPTRT